MIQMDAVQPRSDPGESGFIRYSGEVHHTHAHGITVAYGAHLPDEVGRGQDAAQQRDAVPERFVEALVRAEHHLLRPGRRNAPMHEGAHIIALCALHPIDEDHGVALQRLANGLLHRIDGFYR